MPSMWDKIKYLAGVSSSNEVVASTEMALKDRLASPFYGYFFVSWVIFNWKIVYAAFFINQDRLIDKTGLLRNEYLQTLMPTPYTWDFAFQFVIIPMVLAMAALWIFPYGTRIFYRKYVRNKKALKIIELQEMSQEKKEEKVLAQAETDLIKSEVEKAKVEKIAAEEVPEVVWEQEFNKLLKNALQRDFLSELQKHAYTANRRLSDFDKQRLSYMHLLGLFNFRTNDYGIDLTDKGKYFLRRYVEAVNDNPKYAPF